jgi:hypothetical protein
MKNLKLKSFLVVLLSLVTLGVQAQQDPDPLSAATTDEVEVTYQDYLKMQDDYLKGKVSKEKLLKAFNHLTDEWDELCDPKHKNVAPASKDDVMMVPVPMSLNGLFIKVKDVNKKDMAIN